MLDRSSVARQEVLRVAEESKLVGRHNEITCLLDALDRASSGRGELMLVHGLSGSGKTALAESLRRPAHRRNGLFIGGKFNQYDQNVAYVGWSQALSDFCRYACDEEVSVREQWANGIREAVGRNGQLLVELAPQFEELLGIQSPVESISPQESRYRFAGVIRDTLEVICQPEHPLVVFIDDWQWADPASLELFLQLQLGSPLKYLLLVAAYRSDEVDKEHEFALCLNELRNHEVPIESIRTADLSQAAVGALVASVESESGADLHTTAKAIHSCSGGNAFLAHSLIELIASSDSFTAVRRKSVEKDLPRSIVELFLQKMEALPSVTRELLSLAACLGSQFSVNRLAAISERSAGDCVRALHAANGLVQPIHRGHGSSSTSEDEAWFRFVHDRVQQAAHSRVPPEQLPELQWRIARKMCAHFNDEQLNDHACEVAEHLNAGASFIASAEERLRGVELNVIAARKNLVSTAYRSALACHRAAMNLLEPEGLLAKLWDEHHALAMTLFLDHAGTEYLEGDSGRAEALIRHAVSRAETPIEKADALSALVVQHTLRARYAEAIAAGREALKALDIHLPEQHFAEARDAEIDQVLKQLRESSIDDIINLPPASDPTILVAAKVLITLGPPCYRADQELWSVLVPRVVNMTLRHGPMPQVGYSHTALAGLLRWVSKDYHVGRDLCEIAARLMEGSLGVSSDLSTFHLMVGSSARHWSSHISESSRDYDAAIQTGRESGNLQYAAYALGHNMYCQFFQGIRLDELAADTQSSLNFSRTRHNQWAIDLLEGGLQIFKELADHNFDTTLASEWETDYSQRVEAHQNRQVACIYHVMRAEQFLLLGDLVRARVQCSAAESLIHTVGTQGLLPWPEFVFLRAIAGVDAASSEADPWPSRLREFVEQLKGWSEQCPENFRHKYLLAAAELARLEGRNLEVIEYLDGAIASAQSHGFTQWEGIANERAAAFWGLQGNGRLQQIYWQRSFDCFENWGAAAKLETLANEYRTCLRESVQQVTSTGPQLPDAMKLSRDHFFSRHNALLSEYVERLAKDREEQRVVATAQELASATKSLRSNLADQRDAARELRAQRDAEQALAQQLEERVEKRTHDLVRTTNELQQIENRFQACFEAAPFGMFILNSEGRITLANSAMCRLLRYTRDELLGNRFEDFLSRNDRNKFFHTVGATGGPPRPEANGVGKDTVCLQKHDSEVTVELAFTPIVTAERTDVLGIAVDLTARKAAERRVTESEQRLRQIIEGAQDHAIVMLDPEGNIIRWNHGAERITGYRSSEILKRNFACFYCQEDQQAGLPQHNLSVAENQGKFESDGWRMRKDGSKFWANAIITALRDDEGKLVGFSKITRDLTERKAAEEDLRNVNQSLTASKAILRTIMDQSQNLIGVMSVNGTLIDANRTSLKVSGVAAEDVLNRPFVETPWWRHSAALRARLAEAINRAARGESDQFEATHMTQDGGVATVDFTLKPVKNESGRVIYLIPEGRDITSHKQRERELERLIEKVEQSNKELEQFAQVASHDLQEPLRKIASYCQLLKEEQADRLDEDGVEYLDIAINGSRRLQMLVKDLLFFSRITTRGKPLTPTDSGACFRHAVANIQMAIDERRAAVSTDSLPRVMADESQLTLLFQNLIGNAIKFCNEDVPRVHVSAREVGDLVEFAVSDNGIGMDPQFHDRVFQIFQRLHNRRKYSGTGIGLALCKRIVERSGGRIWVDSTPGVGSTFRFTLRKSEAGIGGHA